MYFAGIVHVQQGEYVQNTILKKVYCAKMRCNGVLARFAFTSTLPVLVRCCLAQYTSVCHYGTWRCGDDATLGETDAAWRSDGGAAGRRTCYTRGVNVTAWRAAMHLMDVQRQAGPILRMTAEQVARGKTGPGSDVDIFLGFALSWRLVDLVGMRVDLEDVLDCTIDIIPECGLDERKRGAVLEKQYFCE
jgi:hypothetical protein